MSESYSNSNHGGESVSSSNYGSSKYSSPAYKKPATESVENNYSYKQPSPSPQHLSVTQIKDFLRSTEKGIREYCAKENVTCDYSEVTDLFKLIIVDHDESLIKTPTLQNILLCVENHSRNNAYQQKEIYDLISLSLKEQIKNEKRNNSQLKYW